MGRKKKRCLLPNFPCMELDIGDQYWLMICFLNPLIKSQSLNCVDGIHCRDNIELYSKFIKGW